jgi:hypothetical protein
MFFYKISHAINNNVLLFFSNKIKINDQLFSMLDFSGFGEFLDFYLKNLAFRSEIRKNKMPTVSMGLVKFTFKKTMQSKVKYLFVDNMLIINALI